MKKLTLMDKGFLIGESRETGLMSVNICIAWSKTCSPLTPYYRLSVIA
jgi:hypothetical protein